VRVAAWFLHQQPLRYNEVPISISRDDQWTSFYAARIDRGNRERDGIQEKVYPVRISEIPFFIRDEPVFIPFSIYTG
jgi:hypothetical protein